ncbi:hypothetical protein EVAR_5377_1 [Eumeta japonica]|uniref:Uncharacterized protein n=1 Tax=Eumeta variegata TaxID=151549 RepID=A0A4C1TM87_EUMVA|nr:hypothetical protein EVAR_5377_1 [Eumeta japonica]
MSVPFEVYGNIIKSRVPFRVICGSMDANYTNILTPRHQGGGYYIPYADFRPSKRFVVERQIRGSAVGCVLHVDACCRQAPTMDFRELTPNTIQEDAAFDPANGQPSTFVNKDKKNINARACDMIVRPHTNRFLAVKPPNTSNGTPTITFMECDEVVKESDVQFEISTLL